MRDNEKFDNKEEPDEAIILNSLAEEIGICLFKLFNQWSNYVEKCQNVANKVNLNSLDILILHIIKSADIPSSFLEVYTLLNKCDISVVAYSLRKLLKFKLITKISSNGKKNINYVISDLGIANTEKSMLLRDEMLKLVAGTEELKLMIELKLALCFLKLTYEESTLEIMFQQLVKFKPKFNIMKSENIDNYDNYEIGDGNFTLISILLNRLFFTYTSYIEVLEKKANNNILNINDIIILHLINLKPFQTVAEIGLSLNCNDISTISYSLKKLIRLKIVRKVTINNKSKRSITYQLTEQGVENSRALAKLRQEILIPKLYDKGITELRKIKETLFRMKILYKKLYNELVIHEKQLEVNLHY